MFSYYTIDNKPCNIINEFVDYYSEKYWCFVSEKEEAEILKILSEGLNDIDDEEKLFKILKWKTGINKSEKNIENEHWILKTRRAIDITKLKNSIKEYKDEITEITDDDCAKYFYNKLIDKENCGVGSVYAITLLFFASKGKYPIYDKFVRKALDAMLNDNKPFVDIIKDRYVSSWKAYNEYMEDLKRLVENSTIFYLGPGEGHRKLDRALWVYGQIFEEGMKLFFESIKS